MLCTIRHVCQTPTSSFLFLLSQRLNLIPSATPKVLIKTMAAPSPLSTSSSTP